MDDILVEPFDKHKHERAGFRCGQPSLDNFLLTLVSQYEKRRLGKTFVTVRPGDEKVLGYYTLASSAVAFAHLPPDVAGRLPKHPVPVVLLARLAVDQSVQGSGLGEALLMDALDRSLELSKSLGVFAVEVLAIDDRAASWASEFDPFGVGGERAATDLVPPSPQPSGQAQSERGAAFEARPRPSF